MTTKHKHRTAEEAERLTEEELEREGAERLPDREQMSLIHPLPQPPLDPDFTTQPVPEETS